MSKFREVKRLVDIPCPDCFGTGLAVQGKCDTCRGTGNVKRVIVEIVADESVRADV